MENFLVILVSFFIFLQVTGSISFYNLQKKIKNAKGENTKFFYKTKLIQTYNSLGLNIFIIVGLFIIMFYFK